MPQLIAYDIAGVQPMTGPTGLIFAMRTNYGSERNPCSIWLRRSILQRASTLVSLVVAGTSYDPGASGSANNDAEGTNPALLNDSPAGTYEQTADATGMTTATVEGLDDATSGSEFREMGFSIEKVTVTARARALKAEYSIELAQDLKAIHGLDAEQELATSSALRSLLKSTAKLFVPSTPTLLLVLRTIPLTLVSSTSTLTPMVAGLLRSSKDFCSRSKEMLTQSVSKLVAGRATS